MRPHIAPEKKQSKGTLSHTTGLYPRENLMLRHMVAGDTPAQAARKVYSATTRQSASAIAGKVVRRERFIKALEKAGITDEFLTKKFREGLDATKLYGKFGVEHPDYAARLGYLRTALKTKKILDSDTDPEDIGEPLIIKLVQFKDNTINVDP